MRHATIGAAAALLALVSAGALNAQTTTTETTTTRTVTLTPDQRTVIRDYVVREQRPSVTIDNVEIRAGTVLPPTVQFYSVPQIETYKYGYVNNSYVVVDPTSRRVIEVIR